MKEVVIHTLEQQFAEHSREQSDILIQESQRFSKLLDYKMSVQSESIRESLAQVATSVDQSLAGTVQSLAGKVTDEVQFLTGKVTDDVQSLAGNVADEVEKLKQQQDNIEKRQEILTKKVEGCELAQQQLEDSKQRPGMSA